MKRDILRSMARARHGKKVALVTGATGGIGHAISARLAREGFDVIVHYRRSKAAAQKLLSSLHAGNHTMVQADMTNEREVRRIMNAVKRKYGVIDVIVCNAGINQRQTFSAIRFSDFDAMMDTNVRSAMLVVKYALPLIAKSDARIICIGSLSHFASRSKGSNVSYLISKSALLGFARALALELAPHVLVNTVVPGYVDTRMFKKMNGATAKTKIESTLLKRIGTPDEIAGAVSFLASPDSTYITGQCLHVNGGAHFS